MRNAPDSMPLAMENAEWCQCTPPTIAKVDVKLDVAVVQVAGSVNVAGVGFQQVGMMCGLKPNPRRATPRKRVRARVVPSVEIRKILGKFSKFGGWCACAGAGGGPHMSRALGMMYI